MILMRIRGFHDNTLTRFDGSRLSFATAYAVCCWVLILLACSSRSCTRRCERSRRWNICAGSKHMLKIGSHARQPRRSTLHGPSPQLDASRYTRTIHATQPWGIFCGTSVRHRLASRGRRPQASACRSTADFGNRSRMIGGSGCSTRDSQNNTLKTSRESAGCNASGVAHCLPPH